MAARGSVRLFQGLRSGFSASRRGLSGRAGAPKRSVAPLVAGALATSGAGYGLYTVLKHDHVRELVQSAVPTVAAAGLPASQPSVFSDDKDHALFLWIELSTKANAKEVAEVCKKLQNMVDKVTNPSMRDEQDEILAGVGFGPTFYKQAGGKAKQNYNYNYRRGNNGELPSSAGDVFVHAKCNTPSKLFELAQMFLAALPKDSIKDFEDIYSFVYKNHRDLSGFIDGTENAADEESRQRIAVEKETGGSYVVTQKWIHNLSKISTEKVNVMEAWIGRKRSDSTELLRKPITSHVARMTGGNGFQQRKPFEIVRQSMPFGTINGGAGLFFIGYAASPANFNFMLDNMVGAGSDRPHGDDLMLFTQNVKGTFWYFPGAAELSKLGC